jgi:glycosyltransferase involved in cell wall biosynthesis
MIRIYGELRNGSFGQVTRGLCLAAERSGLFAGLMRSDVDEDQQQPSGADALVAVTSGNPSSMIRAHTLGNHRRRWFVVAPNSNGLKRTWLEHIVGPSPLGNGGMTDGILVPSMWAMRVLAECAAQGDLPEGFPSYVAPHGVGNAYCVSPDAVDAMRLSYHDGQFNVLHITNSNTGRKGTRELLDAWKILRNGPWKTEGPRLAIVTHPLFLSEHKQLADRAGGEREGVSVVPGMSLSNAQMAYAIGFSHIVCQPSRAEGFGLVPLESAACGVPVVVTNCTGHTEHVPDLPAKIIVPHGESGPSEDYPGATAPTVRAEHIASALEMARDSWLEAKDAAVEGAPSLAERWSWENKTGPVLKTLVRDAEREEP